MRQPAEGAMGQAKIDDSGLDLRARVPTRSGQATGLDFLDRFSQQGQSAREKNPSRSPERHPDAFLQRGIATRTPVRVGRATSRRVETTTDKRARLIQEKLDERRNQQSTEVQLQSHEHEAIVDDNGSGMVVADMFHLNSTPKQGTEHRDIDPHDGREQGTVITTVTFPHYQVAIPGQQAAFTIDTLLEDVGPGHDGGEETLRGLTRTGSFGERTARHRKKDPPGYHVADHQGSNENLRRNIEARRSYNTKGTKSQNVSLPARTTLKRGKSMDSLDNVAMENENAQGVGEVARAPGSLSRPQSPSTSTLHGLDFNKTGGGSVVGPILDIEPVAIESNRMSGLVGNMDRRKKEAKGKLGSKEPTMNPGITNTTHMLLNSKISKKVLCFPEISAEQQRKAGCTPRPDDMPYPVSRMSRTSSRSPQRGRPTLRRGAVGTSQVSNDRGNSSTDYNSIVSEPDGNYNTPRHGSLHDSGKGGGSELSSKSSLGLESSRKTSKDRYSRMIALGLPKVNIDIERNHFSRQSLKRRSQKLRERFDMTTNDPEGLPSHGDPILPMDDSDNTRNGLADDRNVIMWDDMSRGENSEITKVSEINKPPDSIPDQSINGDYDIGPSASEVGVRPLAVDGKSTKPGLRSARSSTIGTNNKEVVSVSYYKMTQPGKKDSTMPLADPQTTPRFKYSYPGTSELSLNDPDRLHVQL